MTIAFVSDAIYPYNKGGKEKRLFELSTRLAALGNDVHVYTMHWWDTPEKDRLEHGVTLHAISKLYPLYAGNTRSIKEGIMFGLACLKLIDADADVYDVDHMPFFPIFSSWLVLSLRGRKLHGTWHEALSRRDWLDYMGPVGNVAAVIERVSIRLPRRVTAASAHTQRLISSELKRKRRVSLVASGIDIEAINNLQPASLSCDVLYTGRFVKDKNVDKLISAVAIVAKKRPSIRCVIVGHGIEQPALEALIVTLKVQKQVTILPPFDDASEVYRSMKATKVFCLPSVREGFGIVALEALGCGTPVITVDSPANAAKDFITEGHNGSVVGLSITTLAGAIDHWTSRSKPKNLAAEVASYGWDALAQAQLEVYTL